jgi:hypothetical protein
VKRTAYDYNSIVLFEWYKVKISGGPAGSRDVNVTAVAMNSSSFWDVVLCGLVEFGNVG